MKFPSTENIGNTKEGVINYSHTDNGLIRHNVQNVRYTFDVLGKHLCTVDVNSPRPSRCVTNDKGVWTFCDGNDLIELGKEQAKIFPDEVEDEIINVSFYRSPEGRTINCEITTRCGATFVGHAQVQRMADDNEERGQQAAYQNTLPQLYEAMIFHKRQLAFLSKCREALEALHCN